MNLSAEDKVTRLLSSREILRKRGGDMRISNPNYDLGNFLKHYKPEPSKYEGKYLFIR